MINILYLLLYLETAINIGYSCQLLTDDMVDVFIIDAVTFDEVHQQLMKFRENIRIVNTYKPRSPHNNVQTTNGGIDNSDRSTGTSTPPHGPPAVSIVTFRYFY